MRPHPVARPWLWTRGLVGLLALVCAGRVAAQNIERLPPPAQSAPQAMPPPAASGLATAQAAGEKNTYPIDLPSALRLAGRANPEIGISRQRVEESLAALLGARVILLPSLSGGANYHDHNGNLQRGGGAILGLSEQSLYVGGGAQTVGAGTLAVPAIRILGHLGDAAFAPLAARQRVDVRRYEAGATFNSILLNVSTRYLELMAAETRLDLLGRSQRDAAEAVRISVNFARVGQGRPADANRLQTAASLLDSQVQRAHEELAVAAAELARLLNLDPSLGLRTLGGALPILQLVDPNWRLEQLIDLALRQRPELAASTASIAENETRYRQERMRPLLPTISVGVSAGDFGGGSNLVVPTFGSFAGRTDFDAVAFWTLQNFGAGNVALSRGQRAATDQAIAARTRTLNLVRRQVAEAHARSTAARLEVEVSQMRNAVAEQGYAEELRRIRGGEGLPVELLDSLMRLIASRDAIVAAAASYDQAQFQLFVALGQPPTLPNGAAPVAP